MVRELVEEIRLVPEEGRLRIEVRGELASNLRLAEGALSTKSAGLSVDALCAQIKLVAGTHNLRSQYITVSV